MNTSSFLQAAVIALVLCTFSASPSHADSAAPVTGATVIAKLPATISKPGTYLLKKNLSFAPSTGTAITVTASDVTIDLGGRVLSSSAATNNTNESIAISMTGGGHLAVRNGTLRNFRQGIEIGAAGDAVVEVDHVCTDHLGSRAIYVSAAAGTINIHDCTVRDTGYVTSAATTEIFTINTQGEAIRIADNLVERINVGMGQLGRGIQALGDSLITRNFVRCVPGQIAFFGIAVLGGHASFVSENNISYAEFGISITNGANGKYRDNLTFGCTTPFNGGTAVGNNN